MIGFPRLALSPDELRQRLPDELIAAPWVCWRVEVREGKPTKVPVNPRSGRNASTDEPESWSSFDHATRALARDLKLTGVGVVMVATDDLVGVDLDKCRDPETGEIAPWAQLICKRFAATYGEVTPSGTGLRFYCRGRWPASWNRVPAERGAIEVYCRGRYFTVTGERLEDHPRVIAEGQAALDWIATLKPSANGNGEANGTYSSVASATAPMPCAEDDDLLDIARRATNGARFSTLFDHGDVSAYDDDESRADLALCSLLAFYTGPDPARIDRLFVRSALFREKWLREDYALRTIERALAGKTEFHSDSAAAIPERQRVTHPSVTLPGVLAVFEKWLYLPDATPLLAILATTVAHRLSGDPVWLFVIGPPSSGKTEQVQSTHDYPGVHSCATLTVASLLSGTPGKQWAKGARGGLLREIGADGIIVCKDFGSVLQMHREARGETMQALREIYDGSWHRRIGSDGGKVLEWNGRVTMIAGVTAAIDSHHAVMSALGERFLCVRLPEAGAEHARRALKHGGKEKEMRAELAAAVGGFLGSLQIPEELPALESDELETLVGLAAFVARARSPVDRDPYGDRAITHILGAESPARLAKTLAALFGALVVMGLERPRAWAIVRRVALDSMPPLRLAVLRQLEHGPMATRPLAQGLGYPWTTTKRVLEDVEAYGIVQRSADDELWSLKYDFPADDSPETSAACDEGSEKW